jgi:predicted ArsR family transcriptional regulator
MHSTKTEILALLKRSDGASVDEISSALGLASMTVRQHLTALERDGLARGQEVRRPSGRPHFRFRLTDDGHRRVADGYDRLLVLLVTAVGDLDGGSPEGVRRALFRRAAESLAARHRAEFDSLPAAERLDRVVAVLRAHGGFAEYHQVADGRDGGAFEIRDFSCVFRSTVGGDGTCEWHEPFLRAALGDAIAPAPEPGDPCAACCRYVVPAAALSVRGSL